mgnify:CR=1 FL=1
MPPPDEGRAGRRRCARPSWRRTPRAAGLLHGGDGRSSQVPVLKWPQRKLRVIRDQDLSAETQEPLSGAAWEGRTDAQVLVLKWSQKKVESRRRSRSSELSRQLGKALKCRCSSGHKRKLRVIRDQEPLSGAAWEGVPEGTVPAATLPCTKARCSCRYDAIAPIEFWSAASASCRSSAVSASAATNKRA